MQCPLTGNITRVYGIKHSSSHMIKQQLAVLCWGNNKEECVHIHTHTKMLLSQMWAAISAAEER